MTDTLARLTTDRSGIALPADFLNGTRPRLDNSAVRTEAFDRRVDLGPLLDIVEHSMTIYDLSSRAEWDGWLAPRVHACVRLTPREAAERAIWRHLAVAVLPDYVRARWRSLEGLEDRFLGPTQKQAIARLWWGAELTRNGDDYRLAERVYRVTDLPNSLQMTLWRNRPMALAVATIATATQGLVDDHGDRARDLLKSANLGLRSTVLDALAPYGGPDVEAINLWIGEDPDATLMVDDLPKGPSEDQVLTADIVAVMDFLRRIATPKVQPLIDAFDRRPDDGSPPPEDRDRPPHDDGWAGPREGVAER